jgi:hypothetical protein
VHISITETDRSERIDIGFDHLAGRTGQLQRIGQHRHAPLTDRGGSPIDVDLSEERVVFQESAQTAPMMGESIVAVVLERNDVSDQLSLDLAQRPGTRHRRPVQAVVGGQSSGVDGVHRHDVVDPAEVTIDDSTVQRLELTLPLIIGNRSDPTHRSSSHRGAALA